MLHAMIMAGGSGTRFWPASRHDRPKQLLTLAGTRTMIQATADRIAAVVPAERTSVMTATHLIAPIRQQLPDIPADQIIGEPCRRDTAPCIGLAAALMLAGDPDAVMLVCPADHVIENHHAFAAAVREGEAILQSQPDAIVTYGIPPTYPAESFGYIHRGQRFGSAASAAVDAFSVQRFREKPDHATAKQYVDAGTYYWNSGIFLWRGQTILDALATHQPDTHRHLTAIAEAIGREDYGRVLEEHFTAIEGRSIDYAVMERHDPVVVIEAPFDWDDVGSWQALGRLNPADDCGNTVVGRHVGIDSHGCIVHGDSDHTIVTIDVADLVIVQTDDATLVAPKASEERVRDAVARLTDAGLDHLI